MVVFWVVGNGFCGWVGGVLNLGLWVVGGGYRVGLWVAMVTILFLLNLDFGVIRVGLVVV